MDLEGCVFGHSFLILVSCDLFEALVGWLGPLSSWVVVVGFFLLVGGGVVVVWLLCGCLGLVG